MVLKPNEGQRAVWDWPLRLSLYAFAFLLPFEDIVARMGLEWLGGIKLLGLLIATGLILKIATDSKALSTFIDNFSRPLSLFFFLFIVWNLISITWAPNTDWGFSRVSTYIGLFVVMHALGLLKKNNIHAVWSALLLGATLSVPLGLVFTPPDEALAASGRFTSGGQDPNDYANLLVVILSVMFHIFWKPKRTTYKSFRANLWGFIVFPSVLILVVGVVFSLSRTALVNLFVVLLVWLLALLRNNFKRTLRFLMFAILVTCGLAFIMVVLPDSSGRMVERYSTLLALEQEETWSGRLDIWRAAITVFWEHPLTGVGVGNFAFVSPYYSYYAALIATERGDGSGGVAHNVFLSVMSETGVVGLVLFAALLVSAYALAWNLAKRGESLGYGLLIGLLAHTVAGLTLTWEYVKIPYLLYGSLLGLAGRSRGYRVGSTKEKNAKG